MGAVLRACAGAAIVFACQANPVDADPGPARACIVGGVQSYEVQRGDTLASIGARAGVDGRVIAARNSLTPRELLRPGRALRIDNRHIAPCDTTDVAIVVNVPQRMLFRLDAGGVAEAYPVAVGRRDWATPLGDFQVAVREQNPAWDVPPSIQEEMRREGKPVVTRVPPGPLNPLGQYWLGLSLHNLGIHGTPAPSSIYRAATHGCIRLHPADIAALFANVAIGMRGRVIYEPVLLARTADGIFLEAHPDIYGRASASAPDDVARQAARAGVAADISWMVVESVLRAREGIATRIDNVADR